MSEATSATTGNTLELSSSSQNAGDTSKFVFSALSTPSGSGGLLLRPILPPKSALKGHQRSASHGGVATRPLVTGGISGAGSAGIVSRPSALKTPGHQRAFSQGQILDSPNSGGLSRSGHSRVGSRTDFILPPGHKEGGGSGTPGSAASLFKPGHKRQASRSESIYTLRQGKKPNLLTRCCNFILRKQYESDPSDNKQRIVVPNHLVPSVTNKKDHPNSRWANNYVCTTKYTLLSFIPKNLFEQFHRVANLYFIFIVLLNWFPAINAFGKEISMIPVLFVLGVTAIKDLFEDRRRHISDKRINNSTCRIYDGQQGRYKKVLWKHVRVGDVIHLSNNELIPADVLLLRSSEPHGICYIDTCNLDGETNLKQRTVVRGFMEKQQLFDPKHFDSLIEVDAPSTKIYKFHGSLIHPSGERVPLSTDNLLLRECMVKNTDFVEGIVVYAGHETKALLNNGGPRYKRSGIERQMNRDIIWCVLILLVLCVVGAIGCRMWLFSYEIPVPFIPVAQEPNYEGFLTFFTFIIILQVMIPLSLYVSVEMTKLLQIYHIHNDSAFFDPETNKRIECRALNITEELGQVQYIFSDKTGTLTENKMIFRRLSANGVDYSHASPSNEQRSQIRPGAPMPVIINSKLQEDLSYIRSVNNFKKPNETFMPSSDGRKKDSNVEGDVSGKIRHAQVLQELLLVLAICNTVVVSKHPHHDVMNASGLIEAVLNYNKTPSRKVIETIETEPSVPESEPVRNASQGRILKKKFSNPVLSSEKIVLSSRSNSDLGLKTSLKNFPLHKSKSLENDKSHERYSRLCESRSVTPSPPLPQVPLLQFPKNNGNVKKTETLPPLEDGYPVNGAGISKSERPKLLNIPGLLFIGKKSKSSFQAQSKTPSPSELKPIFEAESPDELALVEAAHSYSCRLLKRTPVSASVVVPGEGLLEFEILKVLPFDATRKMMSVIVRHPKTKQIVLYCKGADTSIFSNLAFTDNLEAQQNIFSTQQQINSYARQGLRVLVMAKRYLSESEYAEWSNAHKKVELSQENREKKLLESFCSIETKLTLLGATGTEDRLQDGVPECIAELMSAGIVMWVLTGDKPETAINIAYSARLFSPQMEPLTLSARNKAAAESAINFYLSDIKGQNPVSNNLPIDGRGVFGRGDENSCRRPEPLRSHKKRVLVVDGKTLTFILDSKSKLQKPFLELTGHCSSVLCCRATPLQKAYIVKIVKEILHKKTLAIGDGANDVSMIQTADVGVGISGQEGMQAIMASDYALSRFKFLEKLLLVHGHWCYDRIARMVLYFFYKNATFVFLIFWYQLYCGYSAQVMIDQMHLMLYNLLFTSLPPLAIGVYEQDAPEELLMANPSLYSQGRLGHVYQPHSFWITMADSLYQAIVIFFITLGAYHDSDIGLWEFGTTITTSCLFIMLAHVAIETKSWTVIHVISIFASIFLFFSFSLLYNGLCVDCLGLPSNYWVMQMVIVTPVFWLVILLTTVLALLPRFLYICYSRWLSPHDVARAVRDRKTHVARGEEFLASWSRSTSTSSIYRTLDTSMKGTQINALTSIFTLLGGQTNPYPSDVNVNWLIDRLGTAMPSAGNSTSTTPANIPSNEECGIRDVWAHNLDEEFKTIRQIVQKYHWIAMDTEFPGVVARPLGEFRTNADYQYRLLKLNVDLLRIIQLGLTFLDENGKTPGGQYTTWQFNFKFNLSEDMYAQDSIDLLQNSGIQFKKHEEEGIEPLYFAELLMTSGIVLMDNIKWLSFHSCYDFGYLIKLLTDSNLPEEEAEFFDLLKIFFPTVYDVKYLMRSCKFLKGGLQEVADQLELLRIGPQHQAGSDSLLTGMAFFKMKEMYFEDNIDESKYSGHLCNLGNSFFVNGSGMNIPPGGFHDNGDTSTS